MSLLTYDPKMVVSTFGFPITGYGPATFVTIDQNQDTFTLVVGNQGEGARAKSNDESGLIVFTLLQTSLTNGLLTAAHNADKAAINGLVSPFLIKDLSGFDVHTAENAWIVKPAKTTYSNGIEMREWTIATEKLITAPGGNLG